MQYTYKIKQHISNPLWLFLLLATIIVACGGEEPAATSAPAAPAATTAPAAQPTDAPAATTPSQSALQPTATLTSFRPTATPVGGGGAPAATNTPVPTPTQAPAPIGQLKVNRVIAAMPVLQETNRIWEGPWSLLQQHVPFADTLLRNDPTTGAAGPGLASSWEFSDDFTQWNFVLREGVQYHFGNGEFTSADVAWVHSLLSSDDSVSTMSPVWRTVTVDQVGDYEISFNFETPYLDGLRLFSRTAGDLYMFSKAQFDAEGMDAIDDRPAGTGHYRYLERSPGLGVSYELAETSNWPGETPDFPEFELKFITEDATRMAVLLAGDAHIANLSRDLQVEAANRGMRIISSQQPTIQTVSFMLGQYFLTGDESYKPDVPFEDIRVREAINRAVNRANVMEFIYKGSATPVYVYGWTPSHEGWDPRFEEEFEANYGFDPDKARQLLEEAGYGPGDIEIDFPTMNFSGNPELSQIAEAIQLDLDAVGITVNLQEMEYTALRPDLVAKQAWNKMWMSRNLPIRTTQEAVRVFYADEGVTHAAMYDELEAMYQELKATVDLAERDEIARKMGNFAFDNYISVPIAQIFYELSVDPEIVSEYIFSGQTPTSLDHIHLIRGVRE
jgi:ABC-type transport system substrate-binding protein